MKIGSTIEYCFGTDFKTVLCEKIISPEMEYETSDLWNERFGTLQPRQNRLITFNSTIAFL